MDMTQTPSGTHSNGEEAQLTGQKAAQDISEEARERAQEEFVHLAPGPSDPLHFGGEGAKTQLDEDPISEVNPFQESRP
jgi:hypothetical protein